MRRSALIVVACAAIVTAPTARAGSGDSIPYGAQAGRLVVAVFDAPHVERRGTYTLVVSDGPKPGEVRVVGSVCHSTCTAIRRVVPGSLSIEPAAASMDVTLHEIGQPVVLRGALEPTGPAWGTCIPTRGPRYELVGMTARVRWSSPDRQVYALPLCGYASTAGVAVFV